MNHDHSPSAPIVLSEEMALEVANSRKAVSRETVSSVVGKVSVDLTSDDRARFEASVSNLLVSIGYRQAVHHHLPLNALKAQPLVDIVDLLEIPIVMPAVRPKWEEIK